MVSWETVLTRLPCMQTDRLSNHTQSRLRLSAVPLAPRMEHFWEAVSTPHHAAARPNGAGHAKLGPLLIQIWHQSVCNGPTVLTTAICGER